MLQTSGLRFAYNATTTFQFPDITLESRDALVITGSSGKGKTTMLHLLAGLLRPAGGSIRIDDTDIAGLNDKKIDRFRGQHIGIVFQQSHFIQSLSVLENVVAAQYLSGRKKDIRQAGLLLDALGVGAQVKKRPEQLSVGQQQRVSIARALINRPAVLLADEPTSSLDDDACEVVGNLLLEQSRQYRNALVVVTHDKRVKQLITNSIPL